ncbi:SDR family oxidoreductase [Paenibacillus terrigena]|uniref:SDR family oxidoreductase n=1 Tax=Paenibacillus terrigena TaxID=369333 RepID=UPI00037FD596|nr:NAD(P)-dependent oxidoreductase [Paenibacillus terrigena]
MSSRRRVLITGAQGRLGTAFRKAWTSHDDEVIALSRQELDVKDAESVMKQCERYQPNIIIHTAGYTDIDLAEEEPEEAYRINAYGARHVALAARAVGAQLVHFSTDQVFQGSSEQSYEETSYPLPVHTYGASKVAGDRFVQAIHPQHLIVRTAWLFGTSSIKEEISSAACSSRSSIWHAESTVIGCPTYVPDLIHHVEEMLGQRCHGLYHVTSSGSCSMQEFRDAIGALTPAIDWQQSSSDQAQRRARRPERVVLEPAALIRTGIPPMRHWYEALADWMNRNV